MGNVVDIDGTPLEFVVNTPLFAVAISDTVFELDENNILLIVVVDGYVADVYAGNVVAPVLCNIVPFAPPANVWKFPVLVVPENNILFGVKIDNPVPPNCTLIVDPLHVPVVIMPVDVIFNCTALGNVDDIDGTDVPDVINTPFSDIVN
jgi:hypothetical protein